jgi:hypothetical protein
MNQSPSGLSGDKPLTGFVQYKSAEGLGRYEHDLK